MTSRQGGNLWHGEESIYTRIYVTTIGRAEICGTDGEHITRGGGGSAPDWGRDPGFECYCISPECGSVGDGRSLGCLPRWSPMQIQDLDLLELWFLNECEQRQYSQS